MQKSTSRKFLKIIIAAISLGLNIHTSADDKPLTSAIELRKIDLFTFGYIGFAGHISNGQKLYEEILKSETAEVLFLEIVEDPSSSVASKLYSLCGLKNLSSKKYSSAKESIFLSYRKSKVSTMKADVMDMEDVGEALKKIDEFECEIHAERSK